MCVRVVSSSSGTVSDEDDATLQELVVQIEGVSPLLGDEIACHANASALNITSLPPSDSGSLLDDSMTVRSYVFAGPAPVSSFETLLHSCGYVNTALEPAAGTRTVAVTVSDGKAASLPGAATVAVSVELRNDNAPAFDLPSYTASISEAAAAGAHVVDVRATDADGGDAVTYTLTGTSAFAVNASTGVVTSAAVLDREAVAAFTFTVTASDGEKSSSASVHVTVTDINDNSPVFSKAQYIGVISEAAQAGAAVAEFSVFTSLPLFFAATDADAGANGRVSYSLTGSASTLFAVDVSTGQLTLKTPSLDYETRTSYSFSVLARDAGSPSRSAAAPVQVLVTDANDNAPVFDALSLADASVTEAAPEGRVLKQLLALDADNGDNANVKYYLHSITVPSGASVSQSLFVVAENGTVRLAGALDREQHSAYTVQVIAQDQGTPSKQTLASFQVLVTDTNDNCPVLTLPLAQVTVAENAGPETLLLTIGVADADTQAANNISVSALVVGDDDSSAWPVAQATDETETAFDILLGGTQLDYETAASVQILLFVSDGACTVQDTFEIAVTDVNDNAPIPAKQRVVASVPENAPAGTLVTRLNASDADPGANGQVLFFLAGDNNSSNPYLEVTADGHVRTLAVLDREVVQRVTLVVGMSDAGSPERQVSDVDVVVVVTVLDENDNTPAITSPRSISVAENNAVGAVVTTITARDADSGANGQLHFVLVSGNAGGEFSLNETTGELRALISFDREQADLYAVVVRVSDSGAVPRSSTAAIAIVITDVNEPPTILSPAPLSTTAVPESTAVGQQILQVSISDADEVGRRGNTFAVETVPAGSYLHMNATTGVLSLAQAVDVDALGYELELTTTVFARDANDASLFSIVRFTIKFTDVNDHAPAFALSNATISEAAPAGTIVFHVNATDVDLTTLSRGLYYEVASWSSPGALPPVAFPSRTSPTLVTTAALDFETAGGAVTIDIRVLDSGVPQLSATQTFELTILDANDEAPVFAQERVVVGVQENTFGVVLAQMAATDADSGDAAVVTYSLLNGTMLASINASSGVVMLDAALDAEAVSEIVLAVQAQDSAPPFNNATALLVVQVQDVNDNAPVLTSSALRVEVEEGTYVSRLLFTLAAVDADSGGGASSQTSIILVSSDGFPGGVVVNPTSGAVTTRGGAGSTLDFETRSAYNLTFRATDLGSPALSSPLLTVSVAVTDVNDNAPVITMRPPETLGVSEGAAVGQVLFTVAAQDADAGENGRVTFTSLSPYVRINSNSGRATLAQALDREQEASHGVAIWVADNGTPSSLGVWVNVTLRVLDENDNAPQFCDPSSAVACVPITTLNVTVTELATGTFVVRTQDADEPGPNSNVRFFGYGDSRIVIAERSGVVTYSQLTYEPAATEPITFSVFARDLGTVQFFSQLDITFHVTDINNNAPEYVM